ncbi:rho GTPase-activating protein 20-like [Watersipora subatra]|uniref:rho GTPase-activating protein 20-like n=1 Tax=Watersipora subatra TaxID=2589382 RepID=UPI00355BBC84
MMTRRNRSRSLTTNMPSLRDIAVDSSLVMLAFLNNDQHKDRLCFGEPLSLSFKGDTIPTQLLSLLRYMNDNGVDIPDVFRRPGNTVEQKRLIKKLSEGKQVNFSDYNFYTIASVLKRFLLCIPGGILGEELETKALTVLYIENTVQKLETLNDVISCLPTSVQNFLTLLFGLWYRVAQREHIHQMSAEAMAKSVTGSIFVNTTSDPRLVKNAAKVMEIMIENFTCPLLFGYSNLQFFSDETFHGEHNEICSLDQQLAEQVQGQQEKVCNKTSDRPVKSATLPHIDEIKLRQLDRLKRRTAWFLSNNRSTENSPKAARIQHSSKAYKTRQTIDVIPHPRKDTESDNSTDTEDDKT